MKELIDNWPPKGENPPESPGLYMFISKFSEIQYIGKSQDNIRQRMTQHFWSINPCNKIWLKNTAYFRVSRFSNIAKLAMSEIYEITGRGPIHNKRRFGEELPKDIDLSADWSPLCSIMSLNEGGFDVLEHKKYARELARG